MSMNAKEAAQARERLGLSVEDLAADQAFTPDVVRSWETGAVKVPARVARELQWELAVHERQEALAESGLPECEWVVAFNQTEFPKDMKAQTAHMEQGAKHLESCSVCLAREQFVEERFGQMPKMPMPGWMVALGWISKHVEKLPSWTQPAVWVGLAFGAYSLLRVVAMVPAILREPRLAGTALLGLSASLAIGASLGLAYGGFRTASTSWKNRHTHT